MIPVDPGQPSPQPRPGGPVPAGGAAPLALTVRRRIPYDMPFSVRVDSVKALLPVVGFHALLLTLGLLPMDGRPAEELRSILFRTTWSSLLFLTFTLFVVWATRVPTLAVGPAGIWWQSSFGRAVHLPWDGVALVQRRSGWLFNSLILRPQLDRFPDAVSVLTRRELWLFRRYGIRIPLYQLDRSPAEILTAIPYYSRDRCRVSG